MSKYDRPLVKLFNFTVVAVVLAVPAWLLMKVYGIFGLLMYLPVAAWLASRAIVHGADGLWRWLSTAPLAKYHGSYYQFNGEQVRVQEHNARLWFAAQDVMRAIRMQERLPDELLTRTHECAPVPGNKGMWFTIRGLEDFVVRHSPPEGRAIVHWAHREVVGPWEKKKAS